VDAPVEDCSLAQLRTTAFFNIHNVPALGDRSAPDFSGIITEVRWHILDWRTSPFGMSLSINPLWRRADPTSGQSHGNYAFPVTLLVDSEVIPEKFFTVLNLIYQPSFLRPNGRSEHDDSFTIIAGGSYAILPKLCLALNYAIKISPRMETSTRMRCSSALSSS
jgi:hypothetical protein